MSELNIAILGAGSIGCYLGGLLVHAGQSVSFIGRACYQKAIAENGLRLTNLTRGPIALKPDRIDFRAAPDEIARALGEADIVALCTKSQDTQAAAAQIKAHCKAGVLVVSFQNGVRNPETLKAVLPPETVLAAIVPFNVTPAGDGAFHCGTEGELIIEASHDARLTQLKIGFEAAGQGVKLSDNIEGDQWAKMIVNLNNGLNTLSGGTLREGLLQRDYRRALGLLVAEGLAVAKARGIKVGTFNGRSPDSLLKVLSLPNFAYRIVMQVIVKIDAKARSSMLDDLEAGRGSEVDYLQGEIVRQAAAANISAPYNTAALDAVKAAFHAGASPKLSGSEILALLKPT